MMNIAVIGVGYVGLVDYSIAAIYVISVFRATLRGRNTLLGSPFLSIMLKNLACDEAITKQG